MNIRRIFITIVAVMSVSAVFADTSSVTSKKYVDDIMTGYQNKIPGSGTNKLMIYDSNESDGINQKAIVSSLGENTSATDVPNVGAVLDGLDGKQETFNGTTGYVMTGMGTNRPGEIGERAIYSASTNYPDALVTAEAVNTGVINAVNNSLRRVNANGEPDNNGTLWEIADTVLALSFLPAGYTQLEWIESSGAQYIDTLRVPNNDDIIEQKFKKKGTNTATCSWYGSMPSSSEITPRIGVGSFSSQGVLKLFAGSNYTGIIADGDTQVHTLRFQVTGRQELTYTLDGVTGVLDASTSLTPIDMYEPAIELTSYLFARHGTNGVQVYDNEGTRIYYHREYLANGTLVLDMVPCKNPSNVIGMCDTVSGRFFQNLGTGNFTAGPAVAN